MSTPQLDQWLKEVFQARVQRVVFISAKGGLLFQDVVAVIDVASHHADHVALVTPAVEAAVAADPDNCIDQGFRFPQMIM